ncbi:putative membrane protein [Hymenobacter sp. UYAg731]
MPDLRSARPVARSRQAGRWALMALLLLALLLIGVYDEQALSLLTVTWKRLLAATGLHRLAAAMQQGINGGITKRLLPAVATYAALYIGICLLLLRLVLAPAQWRMALALYAGTLVVYVAIILVGKLAGDAVWAYRLSRQILDFVVSPLPVAGLYVLFRTGFGPRATRT